MSQEDLNFVHFSTQGNKTQVSPWQMLDAVFAQHEVQRNHRSFSART